MSEIKIPVSWLRDKGIYLLLADSHHFLGSMRGKGEFVTSFAERENTGKQPVPDWVPVIAITKIETFKRLAGNRLSWALRNTGDITKWKPDAELLMEIYMAEQEKKKLNEQGFEDVVRYGFDQTNPQIFLMKYINFTKKILI